jgi:hypothetical protein
MVTGDPMEYARNLIRERLYAKPIEEQTALEIFETINEALGTPQPQTECDMERTQDLIQKELDDLRYPQKCLPAYTGEPLGAIHLVMRGGNAELGRKCIRALKDVSAKLMPKWEHIKEHQHKPTRNMPYKQYVLEGRPTNWKVLVSTTVGSWDVKQIKAVVEYDVFCPTKRHPVARLRGLRLAAGLRQEVVGAWMGLNANSITALEMRDPYKYGGEHTAECQRRIEVYEEIMAYLLYCVSETEAGKLAYMGTKKEEPQPVEKPKPDGIIEEPASLRGSPVHIKIEDNGSKARLDKAMDKIQDKLDARFADLKGIPEHSIIEYVAENPHLFLKIAQKMNANGVVNPALLPNTSDDINGRRAELMLKIEAVADGMEKRAEVFVDAMGEINILFNELIGMPPTPKSVEHANQEERLSESLKAIQSRSGRYNF